MSAGGLLSEAELQICPHCGDFVVRLSESTGWCEKCTSEESIYTCQRCGEDFRSKTHRPYCTYCRDLNWLEAHADEIEDYMIQGCSFTTARKRVSANHQPICLGCGSHLPKVGFFCKKKARCRSLYRKFHKLRQSGMSTEEALSQTIDNG